MKNSKKFDLDKEIRFYDKTALEYSKRRSGDLIWEVPESMLLLKKKYFKQNDVILDMGCGPAISIRNVLSPKKIKNYEYTGIDISNELLKIAKTNIPTGEFIKADMSVVKFPPNYANVIISLGVLHHADNKKETLNHWEAILKKGGLILLREPTYEVLKKGEGESPNEEGIKVDDLMSYVKSNRFKLISFIYFSTPAFHFFNRAMIKLGIGKWQKNRELWYPVVLVDVIVGKLFSRFSSFFKGEAFVMVLKKL